MAKDDTGRSREPDERPEDLFGRPPTGDESPREVGKTLFGGLVAAYIGRFMLLNGLLWLLLGGSLLTAAWALAQEELERRKWVETFGGRTTGTIEEPWWQLEGDPEILGDGTHWRGVTAPTACAHLRFRPEEAEETVTTFCRRFSVGLGSGDSLTRDRVLGPTPVRWVDGDGMPRIELRIDPRLVRWLDERGPEMHRAFYDPETFHGPDRARRADRLLGRIWRDLDDPFLRMLEEWSKPPSEVTVAYEPSHPKKALPLPLLTGGTVDDVEGGLPIWALAVPFGLFGLLSWGAGSYLVTGGSGRGAAVLLVLGLIALPWAAGPAVKLVGHVWEDAELAVTHVQSFFMSSLPPDLELDVPDDSLRSEGDGEPLRVAWTLEMSSYAPLLRWIDVEPPPDGLDADGVLRHVAGQVRVQALDLPDEELAALLDWVTGVQKRGQGEELGLLFVDAALALRGDPDRSREVRWSADDLLTAIALHPPPDNPYRLAVEERQRILARLPAGR